jgi:hypothetical protein
MSEPITIYLVEAMGGADCSDLERGKWVYDRVVEAMAQGQQTMLSFKGRKSDLWPSCLDYVVGRLYEKFDEVQVDHVLLGLVDANKQDRESFAHKVQKAKKYYGDPARYSQIFKENQKKREKNDTKAPKVPNTSKAAAKTKSTANKRGSSVAAKVVDASEKVKQKADLTTIYPFPGISADSVKEEIAAEPLVICLTKEIGLTYCCTMAGGRVVCDAISAAMERGQQVILSFEGVQGLTLSFLQGVLSGLFENFSEEEVAKTLVGVVDADKLYRDALWMAVDHAKEYYKKNQNP